MLEVMLNILSPSDETDFNSVAPVQKVFMAALQSQNFNIEQEVVVLIRQ